MPHFGHKPDWDILNMTNYFNEISAMCAGGARADEPKKKRGREGWSRFCCGQIKKFSSPGR